MILHVALCIWSYQWLSVITTLLPENPVLQIHLSPQKYVIGLDKLIDEPQRGVIAKMTAVIKCCGRNMWAFVDVFVDSFTCPVLKVHLNLVRWVFQFDNSHSDKHERRVHTDGQVCYRISEPLYSSLKLGLKFSSVRPFSATRLTMYVFEHMEMAPEKYGTVAFLGQVPLRCKNRCG